MRKINKLLPIKSFSDFVRISKPVNWSDCNFAVKNEAREFMLLYEQHILCGYTEIYIDNEDCHIDHYVKRSLDNRLCYNWSNLIVSVNDEDFGAKYKDSGAKHISNLNEYKNILNPVVHHAESYFKFGLDGQMEPGDNLIQAESEKARNTIDIFNLNHTSLKDRRKNLIQTIFLLNKGGLNANDISLNLENSGFTTCTEYTINNLLIKSEGII